MKKYKDTRELRLQNRDYRAAGCYFVTICTLHRAQLFGQPQASKRLCLSPLGQAVDWHWLDLPKHFPNIELDAYAVAADHFHALLHVKKVREPLGWKGEPSNFVGPWPAAGSPEVGPWPAMALSIRNSNLISLESQGTQARDLETQGSIQKSIQMAHQDGPWQAMAPQKAFRDSMLGHAPDYSPLGLRVEDSLAKRANPKFKAPAAGSLSVMIGSFKSAVSRQARLQGFAPQQDIWQTRFYDKIIRGEKQLEATRRYILRHPQPT